MKVIKASNLHFIAAVLLSLIANCHDNNSYICSNSVIPCSVSNRICNEALTAQGAHRCSFFNDCMSGRSCTPFGWCEGTGNVRVIHCPEDTYCKGSPLPACSDNTSRICNEGLNSMGPNRCEKISDCLSGRECSDFRWCQGNANAHEIDCSTLDNTHPENAQPTAAPVTCSGFTTSLSDGLLAARVPNEAVSEAIRGIDSGANMEELRQEDNAISDAFASLNDEEFQKMGKILQDIETAIPENSCPSLQTEVRKISVYLANSRQFNIIPPVITSTGTPTTEAVHNEPQSVSGAQEQATTSGQGQVAPAEAPVEQIPVAGTETQQEPQVSPTAAPAPAENNQAQQAPPAEEQTVQQAPSEGQPQEQTAVVAPQEAPAEETKPSEAGQEVVNVQNETQPSPEGQQNQQTVVAGTEEQPVQGEQQPATAEPPIQEQQPAPEGQAPPPEEKPAIAVPIENPSPEQPAPTQETSPTPEEQPPVTEAEAPANAEQPTENAPVAPQEQAPISEEQAVIPAAGEQAPPSEEQAPPAEGQVPPSEEQVQPTEGQAPPSEEQAQPTQGQIAPAEEQAPPSPENAPPAEEQAPVAEETPQTPEVISPVVVAPEAPQEQAPAPEEQPAEAQPEQPAPPAEEQPVIPEVTTPPLPHPKPASDENEAYILVLQAMQARPGQEQTSLITPTPSEAQAPAEAQAPTEAQAQEEAPAPIAPETVTKVEEAPVLAPENISEGAQNLVTSSNSKSGLNNSILKILQINKEFTEKIKASTESDEKVINLIIEDFFKDIFGNPELKVKETPKEINPPAAPENTSETEKEVFEIPGINEKVTVIENHSSEFHNPLEAEPVPVASEENSEATQTEAPVENAAVEPTPVNELDNSLPTVLENPATGESTPAENQPENSSLEVSAPALRLLTILKLYKEHLVFKDSNKIVDYRHYGHLKDFQRHLKCLVDQTCNFEEHLLGVHQDYQTQSLHQAKHLEGATVVQERSALGRFWCKIRGFFGKPCEDLVVLVHPQTSSQAHLSTEYEQRGFWARAWCGIRSFFRRPCPDIPPLVTPATTHTTTLTAHLMDDDDEGSGFFTFMTSRKLATYINSASKHLIAHKEEDLGTTQASEEEPQAQSDISPAETNDSVPQSPSDTEVAATETPETENSSSGLDPREHVESIDDQSVVVVDTTDCVRSKIQKLIDQLPESVTNEDIKSATHEFIEEAHEWLTQTDQSFPNTSRVIEGLVNFLRASAAVGKTVTGAQLREFINFWQQEIQKKIDAEFTKDGVSSRITQLEALRDDLESLKTKLQECLPLDSVLSKDLQSLIDNMNSQIKVFSSSQDASEEDFAAARINLKTEVVEQANGLDTQTAADLVNSISKTEEDILTNSNFGKSLNTDNFNFIAHKVIQGFLADLIALVKSPKASEFVLDVDDLNLLADKIIQELKRSQAANEKAILDLRDLHEIIQALLRLDIHVDETSNKAIDAAELLKKYDEAFYKTVQSQEFHEKLKDYINKYFEILKAHTQPWNRLVAYSEAYKALTVDVTNPDAVKSAPQVIVEAEPVAKPEIVPTPPAEEQPVTPIETTQEPSAPVIEQPAPPAEEQPAPPIEEQPAPPVEEQPAPPVEEQPAPPVEEQPAPPVEEQPAPPVEEQPAPPVEEQPAVKTEEQPINSSGITATENTAPVVTETSDHTETPAPNDQQSGEQTPQTPENEQKPPSDQSSEENGVNVEVVRLLHSSVYNQLRRLDSLSPKDREFFQFFNRLLSEWAHTKDVNAFTRKLDQIIRALQGRQSGLRSLSLIDVTPSHKFLDKITQFKDSVGGIVNNLGTTYDSAIKLSDTLGEGQALAKKAEDFFSLKNPILTGETGNTGSTSPGFFAKIKSWFGMRRLKRHYGVAETFESLKNVYKDLETAHLTAEELKKNVETAKNFANGVKSAFAAINGMAA